MPYEITVYTGDMSSAGTSADVFIVIYGAELNTGECVLAETKKKKKGCFERGSSDQFVKEVGNCFISRFTTTAELLRFQMESKRAGIQPYATVTLIVHSGQQFEKLPNVLTFKLFKA